MAWLALIPRLQWIGPLVTRRGGSEDDKARSQTGAKKLTVDDVVQFECRPQLGTPATMPAVSVFIFCARGPEERGQRNEVGNVH
jgi:hypothetical protein